MTSLTSLWMLKSAAHPYNVEQRLAFDAGHGPLLLESRRYIFSFTVLEVEQDICLQYHCCSKCVQDKVALLFASSGIASFSWMVGALHTLAS